MNVLKRQDQGTITLSQMDYLPILIESFLVDRKAQGLSVESIKFYKKKLKYFAQFCEGQAVAQVSQLIPDLLRRYLLGLTEGHNPGGVHACFRTLRTLLLWVGQEEIMSFDWKNPIHKVKAPKLPNQLLETISLEDVNALVRTCKHTFTETRDKAMILGLLDTTGVFRPSNGVIFLKDTNTTGFADAALNYGNPGDKPVVGDWDDNGTDTIGVYRNGQFMLRNSNTIGFAEIVFDLGNPGDMPIAGNWDGVP